MLKSKYTKKLITTTLILSCASASLYGMDRSGEEQAAIKLSKSGVQPSSVVPTFPHSQAGIMQARAAIRELQSNPQEREKIQEALKINPSNPVAALKSYNEINLKLSEIKGGGGLKTGGKMNQLDTGMGSSSGSGSGEGSNTVDINSLLNDLEDMGIGEIKEFYFATMKKQSKPLPDITSWKRDQFREAIKKLYQPSEEKAIEEAKEKNKILGEQLADLAKKLISGAGTAREQEKWTVEADKLYQQMEALNKIINAEELKKKEEEEKAEERKRAAEAEEVKQAQIEARRLQKIQDASIDLKCFKDFVQDLSKLPPLAPELMVFFTEKDDKEVIKKLRNSKTTSNIAGEVEKLTDANLLRALRSRISFYTENAESLLKAVDPQITQAGITNVLRELPPISLAIDNTLEKVSGPIKQAPVMSALPIEREYEEAYTDFQKFWNSIKADENNPFYKSLDLLRKLTGPASDAIKYAMEDETSLSRKKANLLKKVIGATKWADYTPLEIKAIIGSLKKMLAPINYKDTVDILAQLKAESQELEKDSKRMTRKAQERDAAEKFFLSGAQSPKMPPPQQILHGGGQGGGPGGPGGRGGPGRGGPALQLGLGAPQNLPPKKKAIVLNKAPQQPVGPWTVVPLMVGSEGSDVANELIAQGVDADVANEAGNAIIGKPSKIAKINAALKVLGNRNIVNDVPGTMKYKAYIESKLR